MASKKPMNSNRAEEKQKRSAEAGTLHDIFLLKLKALYDVELVIEKALKKTAKRALHPDLKAAAQTHLRETEGHIKKVERIFAQLGEKPKKVLVEGIRGIIADADWVMSQKLGAELKALALIAALQYVEHYEIAGYGTLISWAEEMGHAKEAGILKEILAEEKSTDSLLTALGESLIREVPHMEEVVEK